MIPMRRVVITGMGVISPLGHDVATFRDNLFAGVSGIGHLTFPHKGHEVTFPAAPVVGFDPATWIDPKKIPLMDRFAQFAVASARQAFADSGLVLEPDESARTAIITGTGVGGQNTLEDSYERLLGEGTGRVHPFTIPRLMVNAGSSHISMDLGLTGPGFTVASACASALHAIGVAVALIRSGVADRAITGGAEACLTLGTLKGWEALRVMAPDVPRPFSAGRLGMVIGEGGASFVLETEADARARGATIYAEVLGVGMTSDAQDLTTPSAEGAARAVGEALKDAGLAPHEVDHVNAHGTGTRLNDTVETEALKRALGPQASRIPISANKSQFGHALGAAGALEMLATVLALREDRVPPTLHYQGPDPACDLDYVPNIARTCRVRTALKTSFAFGGLNAVLAVGKGVV